MAKLCQRESQMLKVAVIGAGPAGLTAAYILTKNGVNVEVFESDPVYVGGISRTVFYKGFRFDIGGHRFFSKSREIEALWSELLPEEMLHITRLSRIFYKQKFYNYPLEAAEVIENLGKRESLLSIASYLKVKIKPRSEPRNLEDWVIQKFGLRLYRKFFRSYTEKVWGRPCSEIAADWAAQRIKGLSLSKAVLSALRPYKDKTPAQGDRSQQIKTLITAFRYPRLGPGMMWEAAAAAIRANGGQVHLGARVQSLQNHAQQMQWFVEIQGESTRHGPYDHIISSLPLGAATQSITPALPAETLEAAASLNYRDFILVALILDRSSTFPDQWLYIHDPDLKVGRIQNFANWSAEMLDGSGRLCYGMEYFCFENDDIWSQSDSDLIALATKELMQLGLVSAGEVVDGCVVRQLKAYPVYDENYQILIDQIRSTLSTHCPGLHQIGRNGMHRYNNQDHSMMTGILTARNILCPASFLDPWQVNQDAEYIEAGSNQASQSGQVSHI